MTTPLELSEEDKKNLQYTYDLISSNSISYIKNLSCLKKGHLPQFVNTHSLMILRKEYYRGFTCKKCNVKLKKISNNIYAQI